MTGALTRDFPPVIARLIPRLNSPFDNEVVATARAIERTLKSEKLDWHDIAAAVTAQAPPTQWDYESSPCAESARSAQMRAWLAAISREDWINAWTAGFVGDLLRRPNLDGLTPGSRRSRRSAGSMSRERLSNRRACESFEFRHAGLDFTLSAGRYPDGRLAELFLSSNKPGSPIEAIARDAAVTTSIALQFGADLETIRGALTKDHDGAPATLLGAALDALAGARY